jgi:hypothetical protein
MKLFASLLLVFLTMNIGTAQTYEQRLKMTQNKEKPLAKDIRYLLHYSDGEKSDDELISMLETIKISGMEKRSVTAGSALTLNRYKLAKYMIERGYGIPNSLSAMFGKPFSDGAKNNMRPSKQQYTIEETKEYMKYFVEKGMHVDGTCITRLETRDAIELRDYAFELMSDADRKSYQRSVIEMYLRQQKPDLAKVDSVLAISEFNFEGNYMAAQYNASLNVVKEIRSRGGNINAANKNGETFLMLVIRRGRPEVVQYLLNDPEIKACEVNKSGENALFYMKKKVSTRISKSKSYKPMMKQLKGMCE